jgi:hypothetical protein
VKPAKPRAPAHHISIDHEGPKQEGAFHWGGGHRARCSCGWWSDCYSQLSDTQRAIEVHLRRAQRVDFDALIARSSVGAAIADVKARGIDAHLVDLEREMNARRRPRKAKRAAKKLTPEKIRPAARIQLEALALEFDEGGNTIWVHGPQGTIFRVKCSGRITVKSCSAPGAHADVVVDGDIEFCVPENLAGRPVQ